MTEAEAIKKYIGDRWQGDPAADLCSLIIDFIVHNSAADSKMMTYVSLAKIADQEPINEDLVRAVAILSARFDALIMHFMLIDDDGKYHFLEDAEVGERFGISGASHPVTGQLIEQSATNIVPYYEGNRPYLLSAVS